MKTAYELAMERLNKSAPAAKLTDEQKKALAELDSVYSAKMAEREIALQGELAKAEASGDYATLESLRQQFAGERKKLQAELEAKKEAVRKASK